MNTQAPVKLGPLALLLAVISICLATLAILTAATARADRALAEKYADTVRTRYELELEAQEFRRDLSEAFANGADTAQDGAVITRTFEKNGALLEVGLVPGPDGLRVIRWRQQHGWEPDESIHVWEGE